MESVSVRERTTAKERERANEEWMRKFFFCSSTWKPVHSLRAEDYMFNVFKKMKKKKKLIAYSM
jgi:hypothetical protein